MVAADQHRQPPSIRPLLVLVLLAVMAAGVGRVLLTDHATDRHGAEAQQIRECLERNGPSQVWQQNSDPSVRIFCVELEPPPCSRIGILIAQVWPSLVSRCDYRERTSFVPRDGSPGQVEHYLDGFARRIK